MTPALYPLEDIFYGANCKTKKNGESGGNATNAYTVLGLINVT